MVRIDDFHIEYDNQWSVYHPGDEVTGKIRLKLNDKIYVDTLVAHFFGQARVFWVERQLKNNDFRNITFTSEKIYFNEKIQLWKYAKTGKEGMEKKKDEKEKAIASDPIDEEIEQLLRSRRNNQLVNSGPHLTPGSHDFEFSFLLPPELPTSFDARYSNGYIRYSVKVCMMNQDAIKHSRKSYFTVVKPQDLNLMSPNIRQPLTKEATKLSSPGIFGVKGQSNEKSFVRMIGSVEKRGYVPGEPIFVKLDIENRTKKSMQSAKLHLMQHITCHVDNPEVLTRSSSHSICAISKVEKIRSGTKTLWTMGPLYIPAVAPTFHVEDSMEVTYTALVEIYRDGNYAKLCLHLPITVGTVPLEQGGNEKLQLDVLEPDTEFGSPPMYHTVVGIPPPTYEESISGICGENEKAGENSIPRYVVYNYQ